MKCAFKHQYLQMYSRKSNKYLSNFHPLEVVGRGSETQLQVGENVNLGLQHNITFVQFVTVLVGGD